MGLHSKLVYSPKYKVNLDLEDFWCTSAENHNYGKKITIYAGLGTRYALNSQRNLYLHRIVADATVWNPRPDIFDFVDHINGDTKDNHPSNLRWLNHHLNVNWKYHEGETPPGVTIEKKRVKSGKWFASIYFRRCNCKIKSFRTLQMCVEFSSKFHKEHFQGLYNAYLHSPRDPFECRKYWAKRLITIQDFRSDIRAMRKLVLSCEKFLVCDNIYRKLTLKE